MTFGSYIVFLPSCATATHSGFVLGKYSETRRCFLLNEVSRIQFGITFFSVIAIWFL